MLSPVVAVAETTSNSESRGAWPAARKHAQETAMTPKNRNTTATIASISGAERWPAPLASIRACRGTMARWNRTCRRRKTTSRRTIFMPPAVEPASPPTAMEAITTSLDAGSRSPTAIVAKPVVVWAETAIRGAPARTSDALQAPESPMKAASSTVVTRAAARSALSSPSPATEPHSRRHRR